MKKIISLALASVLSVAMLAGCGSEKKEAGSAASDNVLTMATNAEFPPFEYLEG